jgi:hypothetical protein
MLPACNLQAVLPQRLQLPTILCETVRLLHFGTRVNLCSQVLPGSRDVRGSGSGLCSGSGHVCGSVCAQVRSGSGLVRCSLCSGSGEVLRHRLCVQQVLQCRSLRSGSLDL